MKALENLRAWEALVVAAKTGSITRTALVLDMEITRVSRLLTDLEAECGIVFFDKRRRPMLPTPACVELVRKVEPLVDGFRRLKAESAEDAPLRIRFSAPEELSRDFFADYLCTYAADHPETVFTFVPEIRPEQMRTAEVDIAALNHLPDDDSGLVIRHFNSSSTVLLATPEYLEKHGEPKTIEELAGHVGLLHHSENAAETSVLYREGHASPPLVWKRTHICSDQGTLKRMVLNHQGIAVDLFLGHALEDIEAGRIVAVLRGWERAPWHMVTITRTEDELRSPRLRAFAEWFNAYAGNALRVTTRAGWRALNRHARAAASLERSG